MEKQPKSKAPRKLAAKKAAKAKVVARKAAPKTAVAGKPAARGGAAASKNAKSKNIFAKNKFAKSRTKGQSDGKRDTGSIVTNTPLIGALEQSLGSKPSEHASKDAEISGDRYGGDDSVTESNDQGRPLAWRSSLGESTPETDEAPGRINKLVPTNAVHTTKRRMKRNTWQGPVLGLGAIAAFLAILVLGNTGEPPPSVSPLERRAEAKPESTSPVPAKTTMPAEMRSQSAETGRAKPQGVDPAQGLKVLELVEMERMLAQLDMAPSQADGVVDQQTETAIRMYQQIAGLPIDGEPSAELLDDMREVVKLMDGTN